MFNSINCNGPPIRGFFIIWSILYRVDLFVFERLDTYGIHQRSPVHTLRAIWTLEQSWFQEGSPVTHDNL